MSQVTTRQFFRAAQQRFAAAKFLIDANFNLEAVYLAGYGVECSLKALLLARTPARHRPGSEREWFRGRRGHDLAELKRRLGECGCFIPMDLLPEFRRLSSWSTELRYDVRRVSSAEADSFLASAKRIMDWVERSL